MRPGAVSYSAQPVVSSLKDVVKLFPVDIKPVDREPSEAAHRPKVKGSSTSVAQWLSRHRGRGGRVNRPLVDERENPPGGCPLLVFYMFFTIKKLLITVQFCQFTIFSISIKDHFLFTA